MQHYDVIILGGGGAGLMCARTTALRGRSTLIIDHSRALGGKILISGGGRCNFTNTGASPAQYVSQNPHFMKSAMSRYTPWDFIELVQKHGIAFHEKKLGQQFCDHSAKDIVTMLVKEVTDAGALFSLETKIESVEKSGDQFIVKTSRGDYSCASLVVATGGLSIPKLGATGFGYQIAKQFGLALVDRAPALDGFNLQGSKHEHFTQLSGVALDTIVTTNGISFRENTLFTHSGLSGPAILQASLHWYANDTVTINFMPDSDAFERCMQEKRAGNRAKFKNVLGQWIPSRLADHLLEKYVPDCIDLSIPEIPENKLRTFCTQYLNQLTLTPSSTIGYSKAEVTRGGVNTDELSSKTMESKKAPGLYFIGEVVDVTGWLGGYNFQWAWASAVAAGGAA